jgi:hypothetical protein
VWGDLVHVAPIQFPDPAVTVTNDSDPQTAETARTAAFLIPCRKTDFDALNSCGWASKDLSKGWSSGRATLIVILGARTVRADIGLAVEHRMKTLTPPIEPTFQVEMGHSFQRKNDVSHALGNRAMTGITGHNIGFRNSL